MNINLILQKKIWFQKLFFWEIFLNFKILQIFYIVKIFEISNIFFPKMTTNIEMDFFISTWEMSEFLLFPKTICHLPFTCYLPGVWYIVLRFPRKKKDFFFANLSMIMVSINISHKFFFWTKHGLLKNNTEKKIITTTSWGSLPIDKNVFLNVFFSRQKLESGGMKQQGKIVKRQVIF